MRWVIIAAVWYYTGLICFYHIADFTHQGWADIYYLWDKAKDLFFAGAIIYNRSKAPESFKLIFYFCVIRCVWEIVSLKTNLAINNPKAIQIIFVLFITLWLWMAIKELREWQNRKD